LRLSDSSVEIGSISTFTPVTDSRARAIARTSAFCRGYFPLMLHVSPWPKSARFPQRVQCVGKGRRVRDWRATLICWFVSCCAFPQGIPNIHFPPDLSSIPPCASIRNVLVESGFRVQGPEDQHVHGLDTVTDRVKRSPVDLVVIGQLHDIEQSDRFKPPTCLFLVPYYAKSALFI
jgi:hypothetical protein